MSTKLHVKKGDTVCLMTGKYSDKYTDDKGTRRTGKVLEVSPKEGKVIVEGINVVSKHVKPRRMGETGGIVKAEAPIYACKVQIYCPKCKKTGPHRYENRRGSKNPRLQKMRRRN